ncbi:hypothetical protein DFH94DRAFT_687606 [Russula ochroleuca]|uniref:Uncharacterized protein n=1 Tax=Russula ochroleuca TaxID=152965 RepID=A0A9P5JTX9_9AGAM|nr:hypothetical protein DFH94DRAFT_699983 [Russula ochroleuca]KAF8487120.1 hypothetical protein DFH94DRAFT_687606 [Russula ochroleuca]
MLPRLLISGVAIPVGSMLRGQLKTSAQFSTEPPQKPVLLFEFISNNFSRRHPFAAWIPTSSNLAPRTAFRAAEAYSRTCSMISSTASARGRAGGVIVGFSCWVWDWAQRDKRARACFLEDIWRRGATKRWKLEEDGRHAYMYRVYDLPRIRRKEAKEARSTIFDHPCVARSLVFEGERSVDVLRICFEACHGDHEPTRIGWKEFQDKDSHGS